MVQGNYSSEYTQNLMRTQQTMVGTPILDLTNWNAPRYISGDSNIGSLTNIPVPSAGCHSVEVKTKVDGQLGKCPIAVASSIVMCTTSVPTDCGSSAIPCPTDGIVSAIQYMNMVATFDMEAASAATEITFKYVLNGVPKQEKVIVATTLGINTVYAFAANNQYPTDTILVLYGAEVLA
jgi:hypothetical protein